MHYKVVALHENCNFYITFATILSSYVRNTIFQRYIVNRRKVCAGYLGTKMISKEKSLNSKVVDLDKSYNFHVKFIFIQDTIFKTSASYRKQGCTAIPKRW
jgi:hypothetical protein